MEPVTLELERLRRDRQKLLEFIISSDLISQVRSPAGAPASVSAADLDSISADYVLRCANAGGVLDISEGSENFHLESAYPIMVRSQSKTSYFTLSDPNRSGSPPRREPPSVDVRHNHIPQSSGMEEENLKESTSVAKSSNQAKHASERCLKQVRNVPSLGLPPLKTGMSEDDLRESAYEILLASMVLSGIEVLPDQDKVKERSSKLLSGFKSKKDRDKVLPESQSQQRTSALIDNIRLQMQVSEAMDLCIRRKLMGSISRLSGGQVSVVQIVLGLMNHTSRSNFHNQKSYIQWKKRQANILEELLCSPTHCSTVEHATIKYSIGKVRHPREWDEMSSSERAEVLASIRNSASKALPLPVNGQSLIGGETSYEAACYHLKIRLYEKLLYIVFDILDEAQIIAEADDVLKHVKLTWSTLGINQTIHDTMFGWVLFKQEAYDVLKHVKLTWSTLGINQTIHDMMFGWVLFKQFVQTDEDELLDYAAHQLQKVLAATPCDKKEIKERQYQVSLECNGHMIRSSLVPAIFFSITLWCDGILHDYHLHFRQKPSDFKRLMIFALTVGVFVPNKRGEIIKSGSSNKIVCKRVKTYNKRSVQAAYVRVADSLDFKSKSESTHPLVLLADNLKLIIHKEVTVFCPVIHQWYTEAGKISSTLLHQVFGEKLKPFVQDISSFSQDAKLILSAAYILDQELAKLHMLASEGNDSTQHPSHVLDHYNIGGVSGPLILDWVISQHTHILDWIGRAFNLEGWEPLSSQQKLALSAVEVYRMIEETIAQFFGLNLPVNITHLQALLSVTFHSLDAYLTKLVIQIVEKRRLYPPVPSLTRYEEMILVPVIRKKLVEPTNLDEKVTDILNDLTLSKLCIRLNTVNYIKNQVGLLQDGIRKSWGLVKPAVKRRWFNIEEEEPAEIQERTMSTSDESINELFETTFDGIRNPATDAIIKIVDFIGARAVFIDMGEPLLFGLYRGSVEEARMEGVLSHIDNILNHICSLVDDNMRDPVALSIFRASLEAFVWVFDGGPSRAFSTADISLMEDDLQILKDFFIAEGEGLPRSLIENEAKFAHQVLSLFSYQTGSIIQMLMAASENIPIDLELRRPSQRRLDDANTLVRVLCHKKDREASKFLQRQYGLPASSAYDDNPGSESQSLTSTSVITDLLKRSASIRSASSRWSEAGQSSFRSLKQRFQGSNLGW